MPLSIIVIILATALLVILMLKTDMLRDESDCTGAKPFSLSRVQLAIWTLIIFSCFVYMWEKNDFIINVDVNLSDTALILLGISTGVTVLGKTIDASDVKNTSVVSRHQDVCSEGFWRDVLSDKNGVSIHRFQNVIFSLVLMTSFVATVIATQKMPEFDESLLVLSGISSGGYLGIKMNENR